MGEKQKLFTQCYYISQSSPWKLFWFVNGNSCYAKLILYLQLPYFAKVPKRNQIRCCKFYLIENWNCKAIWDFLTLLLFTKSRKRKLSHSDDIHFTLKFICFYSCNFCCCFLLSTVVEEFWELFVFS